MGDAMYKVIVVGTDGTDRARVAVGEALALAKLTGATVHGVHVVHPAVTAGFSDTRTAQFEVTSMQEAADRSRDELLARAETEGVSAEMHHPGSDDVADALIGVAEAVNADLVVVGNRGMTGMKGRLLGSVPNKVSHHCPCNLLIVNTDPN